MAEIDCPDFETVVDYGEQRLTAEAAQQFEVHLVTCPACTAKLAETRQLLNVLNQDAALVVPLQAHRKAVALFRPWLQTQIDLKKAAAKPAFWQRWVAQLVLDSRPQAGSSLLAGAGLRSSPPLTSSNASVRHWLYNVDNGRIAIDLQQRLLKTSQQSTLLGQVLGLDESIERVELKSLADAAIVEAEVDETATFWFAAVTQGEYQLLIYTSQQLLEINSLLI